MYYLLGFIDEVLNFRLWLTVMICAFIIVLLLYVIMSFTKKRQVLVSSPLSDQSAVTDHSYYLPSASLSIVVTAKVIVSKNAVGEIQAADLFSLQLETKVSIVPDTTQLYLLQYVPSIFSDDEINLTTNENELLETIKTSTDDKISSIISTISDAPKNILNIKGFVKQPAVVPVSKVVVEYTKTFLVLSKYMFKGERKFSWIIPIDGVQGKDITCDASFSLQLPVIVTKHLATGQRVSGLLTRPLIKRTISLKVADPKFTKVPKQEYEITVPDLATLLTVPVTRTPFVKKVTTPTFINGLLSNNVINKPSEALGFVAIPVNILKSLFALPAQLLSFKIYHIQKETALLEAQQKLAALQKDAAKTATFKKDLKKQQEEIKKVKEGLNDTTAELREMMNDQDKDQPKNEQPPEEVFIDAIKSNGDAWKERYGVLEVSLGLKKTNGADTNELALIFKPTEKIDHGAGSFVPVPSFIPFTDSSNKTYQLPTDVQRTGGAIVPTFLVNHSEGCDRNFPKKPGCSISRLGNHATGTIGLKVYKKDKAYLLSCYHVLCSTELDNGIMEYNPANPAGGNSSVISPGFLDNGTAANLLGTVEKGLLDGWFDCAIALLNDTDLMDPRICRIDQTPARSIAIGTKHIQPRLKVYMSGRTSKFQSAYIKNPFANPTIDYGNNKKVSINGLIATTSLADEGDSGAVVFDEDCNVVGIVIAKSPSDTYIVPIKAILTKFSISLNP